MKTITENLQIIKDATVDIKRAIIDKGGNVSGDISTWASAISGLSGGGGNSSDEEITFTGTCSYTSSTVTIAGYLNKVPDTKVPDTDTEINRLLALGTWMGGICYDSYYISDIGPYELIVDFKEPLGGNEIPAICILNMVGNPTVGYTYNVIPVKFEKE